MNQLINKKMSLIELLNLLTPLLFILSLLYVFYLQNLQIELLNNSVLELEKTVSEILKRISEKDSEIEKLESLLSANPNVLFVQNGMTQFFVNSLVICVGTFIVFNVLSYTFPAVFSLKALLPVSFYTTIQDYTPFIQERQSFTLLEESAGLDWFIEILNNRFISKIEIRPKGSDTFELASRYIDSLKGLDSLSTSRMVNFGTDSSSSHTVISDSALKSVRTISETMEIISKAIL
jgi:hypothetical protein